MRKLLRNIEEFAADTIVVLAVLIIVQLTAHIIGFTSVVIANGQGFSTLMLALILRDCACGD